MIAKSSRRDSSLKEIVTFEVVMSWSNSNISQCVSLVTYESGSLVCLGHIKVRNHFPPDAAVSNGKRASGFSTGQARKISDLYNLSRAPLGHNVVPRLKVNNIANKKNNNKRKNKNTNLNKIVQQVSKALGVGKKKKRKGR
jgi:hypothetical protein